MCVAEYEKLDEADEKAEEKEENEGVKKYTLWSIALSVILGSVWVLCESASAICVQLLDSAVPDWQLNFIR